MNPTEAAEEMLKVLVNEYDKDPVIANEGMSLPILWVRAGIVKAFETEEAAPQGKTRTVYGNFDELGTAALSEMKQQDWVKELGGHGEPYIRPTVTGLDHARVLNRSCLYRKVYRPVIKEHATLTITIISIIVGVIGISATVVALLMR